MRIGVPKEIKNHEYRVGATPDLVRALVSNGHDVYIQTQAGLRIGYTDELYKQSGAHIAASAEEVYDCEMILKVKEPQLSEVSMIREGQLLFCFFHLAAEPELTKELLARNCVAVAYETVTDTQNRLPLLIPMSEIAGRVAVQAGATYLQVNNGGKGVLLGGVPGVPRAKVVVIGGGVAGTESARMAIGLGANVTVIDNNLFRLRELDFLFQHRISTCFSTPEAISEALAGADLVVGSVLLPGKRAPKLVTRQMLKGMSPGSVVVDIAIDQGGCFETSLATTLDDPVYEVDGVLHYCVTNMPGTCSLTATKALTSATSQYALALANLGYRRALDQIPGLLPGLNLYKGQVTYQPVAEDLGYDYTPPEDAFNYRADGIPGRN